MIATELVVVLLSLLFSAFFSGMEIAFLTNNRLHIELENLKGKYSYRLLAKLNRKPARFIATMLVGNNIALVVFGLYMTQILLPIGHWLSQPLVLAGVQTLISTVVILVLAEFLPKAFFRQNADFLSRVFAIPATAIYYVFYPVVSLMIALSNLVMRFLAPGFQRDAEPVFGRIDLDHYIRERTELTDQEESIDEEVKMFRNALEFSSRKAREFMVPRTDMVSLEQGVSLESLRNEFINSGLSKILIHSGNIDDIRGYVHSYELFGHPKDIQSILRPVSFIPESMAASEILKLLLREKRSLAVVLDEFGGTSGLVTVEDVVEELFGEIDDEHDVEELTEKQISEDEFLFSARLEIEYLNEQFSLELPESEEYSTLGGLIVHQTASIPVKGQKVVLEGWTATVTKAGRSRVEEVRLKKAEAPTRD
ncbi:DUF21 domain-containing protein [bacterium]|nr:DUF21 domain-containing protein [bacterium]